MSQPTFAVNGLTGPSGAQLSDFAVSPPTDIPACTGPLEPWRPAAMSRSHLLLP